MISKHSLRAFAAAVVATAFFAPVAFAGCDFEPKFCNKDTETNKQILVTCSPKAQFVGGYVAFGAETVTLQEKGGTATATATVDCSASGTPLTINVYDKDGVKTELGSFKSGKTKKDGQVVINTASLTQAGTQILTRQALASARERIDIDGCDDSILLTEANILTFDAVFDVATTLDPDVNTLTIVSLDETFTPVQACGTTIGPATLSLDPRFESTAVIDLVDNTVIGTMYTVVDVEGLGTFESQEYLDGTFDPTDGTLTLGFDGDFEPYGRPGDVDAIPTETVPNQQPIAN